MNGAVMAALMVGQEGVRVDPARVTPGLLGFLVVFALALATWALMRSMVRHLRGVEERRAAEEARQDDARGDDDGERPPAT